MCHAPTREPVRPPTAGKRRSAEGQALSDRSLGGRRKLLLWGPGTWAAARSSARPGGPRTALGITHSQHMFPERGLTPEALGTDKAKRGLPLEEFTTSSHTRECHLGWTKTTYKS